MSRHFKTIPFFGSGVIILLIILYLFFRPPLWKNYNSALDDLTWKNNKPYQIAFTHKENDKLFLYTIFSNGTGEKLVREITKEDEPYGLTVYSEPQTTEEAAFLQRLDLNSGLVVTSQNLDVKRTFLFKKLAPFWLFYPSCATEVSVKFFPDHEHLLIGYSLQCAKYILSAPISIFEVPTQKFTSLTEGEDFFILTE